MTEQKPLQSENYLSDAPLRDFGGDAFGRAKYARNLAATISTMNADDGFVIGINAPWGYGKTTLLNFVLHHIEANHKSEVAAVVRFNPWWFSGRENLLGSFFREFQAGLGHSPHLREIAPLLGSFAAHLAANGAKIWLNASGLGTLSFAADAAEKTLMESLQKRRQSVDGVRSKIVDALQHQNKRIVVAIDDIDRLTAEEIREIFGLVKSVTDFPQTIYLLCFDRGVVAKALDGIQGGSGQGNEYIGKIVQMPIELPIIARHQLHDFFRKGLEKIISPLEDFYLKSYLFGAAPLFHSMALTHAINEPILDSFLATPRDVKRLLNAIRFAYPMVKSEVEAGDFIGIQTLQVFAPEFYQFVRSSKSFLIRPMFPESDSVDKRRTQAESALNAVPEKYRSTINILMQHLFPRWAELYGGMRYGEGYPSEWYLQRRVCIFECFDIYFSSAIPDNIIPSVEMDSIVESGSDVAVFSDRLLSLANEQMPDGTAKLPQVLYRMQHYTESKILSEHIEPMLTAIFQVADNLIEEDGVFNGSDTYLGWLNFQLLQRIPESQKRFEILRCAISTSHAIYFIVREVMRLGQQLRENLPPNAPPSLESLLSLEQYEILQKIALEKMRAVVTTGNLHKCLRWGSLLHRLSEWGNEKEAKDYATGMAESNEGLSDLLAALLGWVTSSDGTSPTIKIESVQKFLDDDVKALAIRCEKILADNPQWLNKGRRRQALQTFLNAASGKQSP